MNVLRPQRRAREALCDSVSGIVGRVVRSSALKGHSQTSLGQSDPRDRRPRALRDRAASGQTTVTKTSEVFRDFGRSVVAILRRFPARFIPKGFQPIAGGRAQRKPPDTGSQRQPIPKGLQPCVSLARSGRLESLRDTGTCWNVNRWCSLRSTTGYGLRPLRGGRVARIPRILRTMATTHLRKSGGRFPDCSRNRAVPRLMPPFCPPSQALLALLGTEYPPSTASSRAKPHGRRRIAPWCSGERGEAAVSPCPVRDTRE